MTYGTLISTQTIGVGGASSITFSSIPQTYTDLALVLGARTTDGAGAYQTITVLVNGSGGTQSERYLYTTGTSTVSTTYTAIELWCDGNGATANTFGNMQLYIPNYTAAINKSMHWDVVAENNGSAWIGVLGSGIWASTSAITSFTLTANFAQNTVASLYGIK